MTRTRVLVDPSVLTVEQRGRIAAIVEEIRYDAGCGGQCGFVCEVLYAEFGWLNIGGVYHSPDGHPVGDHVWSVHEPTGVIIDPTADQFGEGADLRILDPGHPLYGRYRSADSEEQEEAWLDAARARRDAEGEYWWVPGGAASPEVVAYEASVARWRGDLD